MKAIFHFILQICLPDVKQTPSHSFWSQWFVTNNFPLQPVCCLNLLRCIFHTETNAFITQPYLASETRSFIQHRIHMQARRPPIWAPVMNFYIKANTVVINVLSNEKGHFESSYGRGEKRRATDGFRRR